VAVPRLPGADKYRRPDDSVHAWDDPLVGRANTEVRVEAVLNDHFAMHVPLEAEGWKTRCPFAAEHEDGGLDRQFRVYSSSNSGYCFALHGRLDPVRLWRLRSWFPSIRATAEDLLRSYGVEYRSKPYRERMALLRQSSGFRVDADSVVGALRVYLTSQPLYEARQYDDSILRGVNLVLNEVRDLCDRAETLGEVETWLQQSKQQLDQLLTATL
jgi:hypothetical protein